QLLTKIGGNLFLKARDHLPDQRFVLWKTDGTPGRTMTIDVDPTVFINQLIDVNGIAYFADRFGSANPRLFKIGPTDTSASLVKEFTDAGFFSSLGELANVNGQLLFTATDTANGTELWTSDGTTDGTKLLRDLLPGPASTFPFAITPVGSKAYFLVEG